MVEWWNSLDLILRVLYCVAVPSTLILMIQTVLSMVGGMDSGAGLDVSDTSGIDFGNADTTSLDGGFDSSFDGSAHLGDLADADLSGAHHFTDGGNPGDLSLLRLFTLQGIVAFLTVFGWTSIVSISSGTQEFIGIIIGLILGFIAMAAIAKLVQLSRRLTENGTVDLRNAIGESGSVYIPIPAKGSGEGKITLYLQGSYSEYSAVTFDGQDIPTGASIRVVDLRNGTFVVERDS